MVVTTFFVGYAYLVENYMTADVGCEVGFGGI